MTHLEALRAAVVTKLAYWDAMLALETAFGYPSGDISDKDNDIIANMVEALAASVNDVDRIDASHVTELLEELG